MALAVGLPFIRDLSPAQRKATLKKTLKAFSVQAASVRHTDVCSQCKRIPRIFAVRQISFHHRFFECSFPGKLLTSMA